MALLLLSLFCLCRCTKNDRMTAPPPPEPLPLLGTCVFAPDSSEQVLVFTNNDPDLDTALRTRLVQTFFEVYPKEAAHFNPAAPDTVRFLMDTAYDGVAATSGAGTTFSAAYFTGHPKDIDVVTHEVMHIVQSYPNYDPVWLVEGIADYARAVYGVDNAAAGWTLPSYDASQHYTDSYRVTARFLLWLEKGHSGLVEKLDKALRGTTYTAATWSEIAGKSVDALWKDYGAAPGL